MSQRNIIVDADPGIDDAVAILYLLGCEDANVLGITTVYGNADIDTVTANALSILELAGRRVIPVAAGAVGPLNDQRPPRSPSSHGPDGLGLAPRPVPQRRAIELDAVGLIASMVSESPEPVSILAIAPLTNIATFCQRYPELLPRVEDIVIMGGGLGVGNVEPAAVAEFNTWIDPEAAAIVLTSPVPTSLVPLNVTNRVTLDTAELTALPSGPVREFLTIAHAYYADARETERGTRLTMQHDAAAAVFLMRPELFSAVDGTVSVNTGVGPHRGKTTLENRRIDDRTKRTIVTDHNQTLFQKELLSALRYLISEKGA